MNLYLYGRAPSSRQHHQDSPRHRSSAHAWDLVRDAIDREHQSIAAADPRSPRIKPTLASFLVEKGVR